MWVKVGCKLKSVEIKRNKNKHPQNKKYKKNIKLNKVKVTKNQFFYGLLSKKT